MNEENIYLDTVELETITKENKTPEEIINWFISEYGEEHIKTKYVRDAYIIYNKLKEVENIKQIRSILSKFYNLKEEFDYLKDVKNHEFCITVIEDNRFVYNKDNINFIREIITFNDIKKLPNLLIKSEKTLFNWCYVDKMFMSPDENETEYIHSLTLTISK